MWAAIITTAIGAVAALAGVVLTAFITGRQEARRLAHEQALKIREERLQAYATMAKITKTIDPSKPPLQADLGQALSEIELLTDNKQLLKCATTLVSLAANTRNIAWNLHEKDKDLAEDQEFNEFVRMLDETRTYFVWLARDELRGEKGQKEQRDEEERQGRGQPRPDAPGA